MSVLGNILNATATLSKIAIAKKLNSEGVELANAGHYYAALDKFDEALSYFPNETQFLENKRAVLEILYD